MIKEKIIETTDGKYVGSLLTEELLKLLEEEEGIIFTTIQSIGNGMARYSNSHYVILTKEITHD